MRRRRSSRREDCVETPPVKGTRVPRVRRGGADAATRVGARQPAVVGVQVYLSDPTSLTYSNNGTTATAGITDFRTIVPGNTYYYWKVTYSGDQFNNNFTTTCGSETATVTFTFVP
jgi:hypothetical protein